MTAQFGAALQLYEGDEGPEVIRAIAAYYVALVAKLDADEAVERATEALSKAILHQ